MGVLKPPWGIMNHQGDFVPPQRFWTSGGDFEPPLRFWASKGIWSLLCQMVTITKGKCVFLVLTFMYCLHVSSSCENCTTVNGASLINDDVVEGKFCTSRQFQVNLFKWDARKALNFCSCESCFSDASDDHWMHPKTAIIFKIGRRFSFSNI